MNLNEIFPSKYLKASDVAKPMLLTVRGLRMEDVDDTHPKPVLYFEEFDKGFVMNKTNGNILAQFLGVETDAWKGKQIVLFKDSTLFKGEMVDCIRARRPKNQPITPAEDDMPF